MRRPRGWQLEEGQWFHCLSRVVDRQLVFHDEEREVFRELLRRVEDFSGLQVSTWTILSNHFHILIRIPDPEERVEIKDEELLRRIGRLYGQEQVREVEWQLKEWSKPGFEKPLRELRESYTQRMYDLSEFMKSLKQRFSSWFNRTHGRKGTLWEERFKSVVVGGGWDAVLTVAAYIDLNSVRAGLASDPKDYRWSGYAEAVAGNARARKGLALALEEEGQSSDWLHVSAVYRELLFGSAEERPSKRGFSARKIKEVLDRNGQLTRQELLRCRVRYFADGTVLGTRAFVDGFFERKREDFSPSRNSGARKMRGGDWGDLASLRDLRVDPVRLE